MRPIGIIASESSENEARVILNQSEEKRVKVEDLVLVDNRKEGKILAVLRKGRGINENLKAGGYNPGVAYARAGGAAVDCQRNLRLHIIGYRRG
jgi:hypothetical protein